MYKQRNKRIVESRKTGATLAVIARAFEISRERVRQILRKYQAPIYFCARCRIQLDNKVHKGLCTICSKTKPGSKACSCGKRISITSTHCQTCHIFAQRKLKEEFETKIIQAYSNGERLAQICLTYQITNPVVYRILIRHKIPRNRKLKT